MQAVMTLLMALLMTLLITLCMTILITLLMTLFSSHFSLFFDKACLAYIIICCPVIKAFYIYLSLSSTVFCALQFPHTTSFSVPPLVFIFSINCVFSLRSWWVISYHHHHHQHPVLMQPARACFTVFDSYKCLQMKMEWNVIWNEIGIEMKYGIWWNMEFDEILSEMKYRMWWNVEWSVEWSDPWKKLSPLSNIVNWTSSFLRQARLTRRIYMYIPKKLTNRKNPLAGENHNDQSKGVIALVKL